MRGDIDEGGCGGGAGCSAAAERSSHVMYCWVLGVSEVVVVCRKQLWTMAADLTRPLPS